MSWGALQASDIPRDGSGKEETNKLCFSATYLDLFLEKGVGAAPSITSSDPRRPPFFGAFSGVFFAGLAPLPSPPFLCLPPPVVLPLRFLRGLVDAELEDVARGERRGAAAAAPAPLVEPERGRVVRRARVRPRERRRERVEEPVGDVGGHCRVREVARARLVPAPRRVAPPARGALDLVGQLHGRDEQRAREVEREREAPVSYTHLTLPTILLV